MAAAIVDTGPLVAFFNRSDRHHRWAAENIPGQDLPLLVCEPVIAEAMYLLAHLAKAEDRLLGLIDNGVLKIAFRVEDHVPELRILLAKYRDTPMSLADACIVRMAELNERHAVLTLDSDFSVYRKHGRVPLPLIAPE